MSVFKLSNNDEEIKLHMEAYIDHANSLEGFYSDYNFRYYDSSWEEGWIEFLHTATAYDMNRYGNMHGGIIMMLADTASGITSFEAGTGNSSPTMDMNISFLKPIHKGDDMIIRAQILYAGKHNCVDRIVGSQGIQQSVLSGGRTAAADIRTGHGSVTGKDHCDAGTVFGVFRTA